MQRFHWSWKSGKVRELKRSGKGQGNTDHGRCLKMGIKNYQIPFCSASLKRRRSGRGGLRSFQSGFGQSPSLQIILLAGYIVCQSVPNWIVKLDLCMKKKSNWPSLKNGVSEFCWLLEKNAVLFQATIAAIYFGLFIISCASSVMIVNQRCWQSLCGQHGNCMCWRAIWKGEFSDVVRRCRKWKKVWY